MKNIVITEKTVLKLLAIAAGTIGAGAATTTITYCINNTRTTNNLIKNENEVYKAVVDSLQNDKKTN